MQYLLIKWCLNIVLLFISFFSLTAFAVRFPYFASQDMVIIFTTDNKPVAVRSTPIDSSRILSKDTLLRTSYNDTPGYCEHTGETVHFKTMTNGLSQLHRATIYVVEVPDLAHIRGSLIRLEQLSGEITAPLAASWTIGELHTTIGETGKKKNQHLVFLKKMENQTDIFFCFPKGEKSSKVGCLDLSNKTLQKHDGFTLIEKEKNEPNLVYFSKGRAPISDPADYEEAELPTIIVFPPTPKNQFSFNLLSQKPAPPTDSSDDESDTEELCSDNYIQHVHIDIIPGLHEYGENHPPFFDLTFLVLEEMTELEGRTIEREENGCKTNTTVKGCAINILPANHPEDFNPDNRGCRILAQTIKTKAKSGGLNHVPIQPPYFQTVRITDSYYQQQIVNQTQEAKTSLCINLRIAISSIWPTKLAATSYAPATIGPQFHLQKEQLLRTSPEYHDRSTLPHFKLCYQTTVQAKVEDYQTQLKDMEKRHTTKLKDIEEQHQREKAKRISDESQKKILDEVTRRLTGIETSVKALKK